MDISSLSWKKPRNYVHLATTGLVYKAKHKLCPYSLEHVTYETNNFTQFLVDVCTTSGGTKLYQA